MLASVLDPVVAACERSADMIAELAAAHDTAVTTSGVEVAPLPAAHSARWARDAYLVNCLHAIQQPLRVGPPTPPLSGDTAPVCSPLLGCAWIWSDGHCVLHQTEHAESLRSADQTEHALICSAYHHSYLRVAPLPAGVPRRCAHRGGPDGRAWQIFPATSSNASAPSCRESNVIQ